MAGVLLQVGEVSLIVHPVVAVVVDHEAVDLHQERDLRHARVVGVDRGSDTLRACVARGPTR